MNAKLQINLDKATGEKPVVLFHSIHHKGMRYRVSSEVNVLPVDWDRDFQQVRKTGNNWAAKNRKLVKQREEIRDRLFDLDAAQRPLTRENLIPLLTWGKSGNAKEKTVTQIFQEFINSHCLKLSYQTKQAYTTTMNNLLGYQKKFEERLSFDNFNTGFGERFKAYLLNDVGVFDNTVSNRIKHLKTFVKWANDNAYCKTVFYKKWKEKKEDGKAVFFLKQNEIKQIADFEFIERLDKVRDLFLIGCYCGLRYADINSIKPIHAQDGLLKLNTKKTGEYVEIPIIPEVQTILDKYWKKDRELPTISNQKGNQYISELVKAVGINRKFIYVQKKDGKPEEKIYEAWEMCSWHTSRHSFATIAIQLGIPYEVVRKVLGHKDLKMLNKYLQDNPEFKKAEMMKMSKK